MLNRIVYVCQTGTSYVKSGFEGTIEFCQDSMRRAKDWVYAFHFTLVGNFATAQVELSKEFETSLALEKKENGDFLRVKKVGRMGYHAAYIVTPSHERIQKLLQQVDREPQGRSSYQSLNVYCQGSFLLAHTGMAAENQRRLLLSFLSMSQSVITAREVTNEVLKTQQVLDLATIKTITRTIIARPLLGVDALPVGLEQILENFARHGFGSIGHFAPAFLRFNANLVKCQQEYDHFIKKFLDDRVPVIRDELKNYPEFKKPNLILSALIDELKKDYGVKKAGFQQYVRSMSQDKIKKYLHASSFIRTIPLILQATESLSNAINYFVDAFQTDSNSYQRWMLRANTMFPYKIFPTIFAALRYEIDVGKVTEGLKIDLNKLDQLKLLTFIANECIRQKRPGAILRYTQKEVKLDNMTIPPHTMINIALPAGAPFGAKPRGCPAGSFNSKVAETIFQTVLATLSFEHDAIKNFSQKLVVKPKFQISKKLNIEIFQTESKSESTSPVSPPYKENSYDKTLVSPKWNRFA